MDTPSDSSSLTSNSTCCHVFMSGLRFSLVGLAGFAPWVFGAGKFGSTGALYTACAIPFFLLGGLALYPDVRGRLGLGKTYLLFFVAFFAFAACWCLLYLTVHGKHGEVYGALAGTIALCLILRFTFRQKGGFLEALGVVFTLFTVGYFIGDWLFYKVIPRSHAAWGQLAWGICFGFGFGAGLGWLARNSNDTKTEK